MPQLRLTRYAYMGSEAPLMLDRLIDVLLNFVDLARFWIVVGEGDRVVVYTLGRPTRLLAPGRGWLNTGLYLKAPLGIECDITTSVREEQYTLANQTLATRDGHVVCVCGSFRYSINPQDVITWQTTLGDENNAFPSAMRAAVAETIIRRPLDDLLDVDELKGLRQEILERCRRNLGRYGYKIHDFWWAERAQVRTYRLITGE